MTLPNDLAAYAVQLRRLNNVWLNEAADALGRCIVDLGRDEPLDVSDQLRQVASRIAMFAHGMQYGLEPVTLCDGHERDVSVSRCAMLLTMSRQIAGIACDVARRAA